jgi:hypothetical protein
MPTTQEIKDQFTAYVAEGRTAVEARQGCRTWTMEQLQGERASSLPYGLRPRAREYKLDHRDHAVRTTELRALVADDDARIAESLGSVADAHHLAASKHNAKCMATPGMTADMVAHGHHYAQKEWGKALWVETDKLVAAALGGA